MTLDALLQAKLREESKETRLFDFLARVTEILRAADVSYVTIGSCAISAVAGRLVRLTRDIDIVVPEGHNERLGKRFADAGFQTRRDDGFVRFIDGRFQVHVVSEQFALLDPVREQSAGGLDLRTVLRAKAWRQMRFPSIGASLSLPVPAWPDLALLTLLTPLNVNSLDDLAHVLGTEGGHDEVADSFLTANGRCAPFFAQRLGEVEAVRSELGQPVLSGLRALARHIGEVDARPTTPAPTAERVDTAAAPLTPERASALVDVLVDTQRLDYVPRSGYLQHGVSDPESVSEHQYHLAFLVWSLAPYVPDLDVQRALELALVHDVPELLIGDFPRSASKLIPHAVKREAELRAIESLFGGLDERVDARMREFHRCTSLEARFVSACDKLQMLIKVTSYAERGVRALDDFWENLVPFPDQGIAAVGAVATALWQRRTGSD